MRRDIRRLADPRRYVSLALSPRGQGVDFTGLALKNPATRKF